MRWCFDFACVTCATLRGLTKKKTLRPKWKKSLIARALSFQCTTLHDIALIMSRFKKNEGPSSDREANEDANFELAEVYHASKVLQTTAKLLLFEDEKKSRF